MRSLTLLLPLMLAAGCVGQGTASSNEINDLRLEVTRLKVLLAESSAGAAFGACRSERYNLATHGTDEPTMIYQMRYDQNRKLEILEEYDLDLLNQDSPVRKTEIAYDDEGRVKQIDRYDFLLSDGESPALSQRFEYTCAE
ncbi:hypothetical protein KKB55_18240 [Myxococcota bacterium]|nr:hypothetical protein [Myxococcota bacterium]MBU1899685.1 hypothetical protein [Myxococcota bacterium]